MAQQPNWVRSSRSYTMWCNDLGRLGRRAYIPCGKCTIGMTAHKLFPFMVPGHWVDRLEAKQRMSNQTQSIQANPRYAHSFSILKDFYYQRIRHLSIKLQLLLAKLILWIFLRRTFITKWKTKCMTFSIAHITTRMAERLKNMLVAESIHEEYVPNLPRGDI